MKKQIIQTPHAPAPIGPYSQAVFVGDMLFVSGQIAIDPKTEKLITEDIISETHQVMQNIKAILNAAGLDFSCIVKTSIFLSNMDFFAQVNEIYGSYFSTDYPARETVQVSKLPKGVNVEISVIASK
jgi:2-iminobutanoate/2-iminopropanoate deaminase